MAIQKAILSAIQSGGTAVSISEHFKNEAEALETQKKNELVLQKKKAEAQKREQDLKQKKADELKAKSEAIKQSAKNKLTQQALENVVGDKGAAKIMEAQSLGMKAKGLRNAQGRFTTHDKAMAQIAMDNMYKTLEARIETEQNFAERFIKTKNIKIKELK